MGQKLTDRIVKALVPPPKGNRITYDTEVSGFGARITAAGAIAFVFNYRRKGDGVACRATIGSFPAWSVTAARERAKELRRSVDAGGDPVGELRAERGAPTVADLCARFVEEHLPQLRPSTRRDYTAIVEQIKAEIGAKKVAAVDYEHIARLHREITKRAPYRANRMLAVLSKMFSLAIRWRLRTDNPCRGVARNREYARRRYLTPEELKRFLAALSAAPNQDAAAVFRFLLLTGARKGEVLAATWDQLDLAASTWRKPPSATKQKRHHEVPLSAAARQLLATRVAKRDALPRVFGDCDRNSLLRAWRRACKAAKIDGLRIHDLRHSYASTLASAGIGLHVIGALLGHTQPATTHRYAHLLDDPLRQATERAGAILSGKKPAQVVPMRGQR
jgi:integrase